MRIRLPEEYIDLPRGRWVEEPDKNKPYAFLCRFGTQEDPLLAMIVPNRTSRHYELQIYTFKQDDIFGHAEKQLAFSSVFPAVNDTEAVKAGQTLIRNTVKLYFRRVQAVSNSIPVNDEILFLGRR